MCPALRDSSVLAGCCPVADGSLQLRKPYVEDVPPARPGTDEPHVARGTSVAPNFHQLLHNGHTLSGNCTESNPAANPGFLDPGACPKLRPLVGHSSQAARSLAYRVYCLTAREIFRHIKNHCATKSVRHCITQQPSKPTSITRQPLSPLR